MDQTFGIAVGLWIVVVLAFLAFVNKRKGGITIEDWTIAGVMLVVAWIIITIILLAQ